MISGGSLTDKRSLPNEFVHGRYGYTDPYYVLEGMLELYLTLSVFQFFLQVVPKQFSSFCFRIGVECGCNLAELLKTRNCTRGHGIKSYAVRFQDGDPIY